MCDPDNPVRVSTTLEARVIVFDIEIPITMGFPVTEVIKDLLLCMQLT